MLLGEVLVKAGSVSADGVEEALLAQALRGGRLGTNLVELGLVSEDTLARALGEQHQLPFAAGDLEIDEEALRRIGSRLANSKDVVPVRMDARRLSIAVIDPRDVSALDAVAQRAGRSVMPVVVPELRVHRLLAKHCGAVRDERGARWVVRRPAPPRVDAMFAPTAAGEELMDERAFEALYVTGPSPRPLEPAPRPPERRHLPGRLFAL